MRQRKTVGKKTKAATKPKIARAVQYADCIDCEENLKRWGPGGNVGGVLCPPCAAVRLNADHKKRRQQANTAHLAVLISVDGTKREVDLNAEKPSALLGGGSTCNLYHSDYSNSMRGLQKQYTAFIRDCAILEQQPENDMALRVLYRLGGFHEHSYTSCVGPVLFTGIDELSLFPEEVKLIMDTHE
jgi:hypothetical protein